MRADLEHASRMIPSAVRANNRHGDPARRLVKELEVELPETLIQQRSVPDRADRQSGAQPGMEHQEPVPPGAGPAALDGKLAPGAELRRSATCAEGSRRQSRSRSKAGAIRDPRPKAFPKGKRVFFPAVASSSRKASIRPGCAQPWRRICSATSCSTGWRNTARYGEKHLTRPLTRPARWAHDVTASGEGLEWP